MVHTARHACTHEEEGSMGRGRRRRGRRGGRDREWREPASEADLVEEARERAEQRVALVAELWRYLFVCGLLLIFVTPVGLAVAFFWGIGLAKRYFARVEAPRLRRRWIEEELGRRLPGSEGERAPARPRRVPVRLAELAETVLAARAERIARSGVALRREADAEGAVSGAPDLLERALGDLVDAALDELELSGDPAPRLDVELGESLAGTEVWLRVRAEAQHAPRGSADPPARRPGLAAVRDIVEDHGGAFEAHDPSGPGFEVVLTFPKHSDTRPAPAST
jgi:hypothetical protein